MERVTLIATTATSQVYQIWGGEGQSFIGKVSGISERFEREAELDKDVIGHLPVWSPRVLRCGRTSENAWILYEDLGLKNQAPSTYAYLRGVQVAARFHSNTAGVALPHGLGQSHTPSLEVVAAEVRAIEWGWLRNRLRDAGVGSRVLDTLHFLLRHVPNWLPRLLCHPYQLCHGDLHYGNLLYSRQQRRWAIIDWEFVHMDMDYFDLFQLMDATSPTAHLARPCSRTAALRTYVKEQRRAGRLKDGVSAHRFMVGYLQFAVVYLFWIALRILSDLEAGKFTEHMLCRQLSETVRGLESIARDLHRCHLP